MRNWATVRPGEFMWLLRRAPHTIPNGLCGVGTHVGICVLQIGDGDIIGFGERAPELRFLLCIHGVKVGLSCCLTRLPEVGAILLPIADCGLTNLNDSCDLRLSPIGMSGPQAQKCLLLRGQARVRNHSESLRSSTSRPHWTRAHPRQSGRTFPWSQWRNAADVSRPSRCRPTRAGAWSRTRA